MLNTCRSGAGLNSISGELSGTSNIIASSSSTQNTHTSGKSGDFAWSFWNDVANSPSGSVDGHIGQAVNTMTNTGTAENIQRAKDDYPGYVAAMKKQNDKRAAMTPPKPPLPIKSEQEYVNSVIQDPTSKETHGNPGSQKLASGTSSNHAIIYRTTTGPERERVRDKAKAGLAAAGFEVSELTAMTQADLDELNAAHKENRPANVRADMATPENLAALLTQLKPKMNSQEHLLVFVMSHGNETTASNGTDAGSGVGGGTAFNSSNNTDTIGTATTVLGLGEEVAYADGSSVTDNNLLTRWGSARLVLQTASTANPSGKPATLFLNGLNLGLVPLDHDYGYHEFELTPEQIRELIDATNWWNGFQVRFEFASAGDFLRLATADDLAASGWRFGSYGMNLVVDVEPVVPEPATLSVIVLGMISLRGIRRTSSPPQCRVAG